MRLSKLISKGIPFWISILVRKLVKRDFTRAGVFQVPENLTELYYGNSTVWSKTVVWWTGPSQLSELWSHQYFLQKHSSILMETSQHFHALCSPKIVSGLHQKANILTISDNCILLHIKSVLNYFTLPHRNIYQVFFILP